MADFSNSNRLKKLKNFIEIFAGIARASVDRAAKEFGPPWEASFEKMLEAIYGEDEALENAVKGYGGFVMDTMRRQKRFEVERIYPAKTYAQASSEVYLNDDYMANKYLPGLLLSHYLWMHHYQQLIYFHNFFVPVLRARCACNFAEVGVGTGIYSRAALEKLPSITGVGFDISPFSLKFAQQHVEAFGFADRYQMLLQNVMTEPSEHKFDAVICVEVLEHIEDPVAMLTALKVMVAPGGKLFVTAALNAAHADHIFLYREPADVLVQVEAAGLQVENFFFTNAYSPAKRGLPVPSALAMVLNAG